MPSERFGEGPPGPAPGGEFQQACSTRALRMPAALRLTGLMAPNPAGIAAARHRGLAASSGMRSRRNRAKRLIREIFRQQRRARIGAGDRRRGDPPARAVRCRLRQPRARLPQRPSAAARRVRPAMPADPGTALSIRGAACRALALLTLYKVLLSPMFAGSCRFVPSCSDYAARGGRRARRRSRVVAGGAPAGALPSARRAAVSIPVPRPPAADEPDSNVNGKAGSPRGRPVVRRAVRLPGAVSAAEAAPPQTVAPPARDAARRRRDAGPAAAPPDSSAAAARRTGRRAALVARHRRARHRRRERGGRAPCSRRAAVRSRAGVLKKYQDARGAPLELVPQTVRGGTADPFTLSVRRSRRDRRRSRRRSSSRARSLIGGLGARRR